MKALMSSLRFSSVSVNPSKKPGVSMISILLSHMVEVAAEHISVTEVNPASTTKAFLRRKKFPASLFPAPVIPVKMIL